MSIDWSKAPEGATHKGKACPHFYRYTPGDEWVFYYYDGKWTEIAKITNYQGGLDNCMIPRPAWTGSGLPPVGTVCEAKIYDGTGNLAWFECRIIHHHPRHKGSAAIAHGSEELLSWSSEFRQIRTPEQIAIEERDRSIVDMKAVFDSCSDELMPTSNKYLETLFGAIHDAGYRKQVKS